MKNDLISVMSGILAAVFLFSVSVTALTGERKSSVAGDVDGNGVFDMHDVTLLLQWIAEWDVTINEKYADVNGDGKINLEDASIMLKYHAEWDITMSLPVDSDTDDLEFSVLGINKYDSIGGVTASEGNKIFVVFLEVKNTSDQLMYLNKGYFDYSYKNTACDIKSSAFEGFSELGGFIAAGTRKKTYIAFEKADKWKFLTVRYAPFWVTSNKDKKSFTVARTDCGSRILSGDVDYPIDTADYSDLIRNFTDIYTASAFGSVRDIESAMNLIDTIVSDENGGYVWEGINDAITRIQRIQNICMYLGKDGLAELPDEKIAKIKGTLDLFLETDYQYSNWYNNEITVPRYMTKVILMFSDYMDDESIEKACEIASRGTLYRAGAINSIDLSDSARWIGSNLLESLTASLYYAAYLCDTDYLGSIVDCLSYYIYIAEEDDGGIWADGSFSQHGMAYNSVYGITYCAHMSRILDNLSIVGFYPKLSCLEVLVDYVVDGEYYLVQHGVFGYMTSGAAIGNDNQYKTRSANANLSLLCKTLLSFEDIPRREELQYVYDSYTDYSKTKYGVKYMDISLIAIMKTESVAMYARGANNKHGNTEYMLKYNILCRNLVYGGYTEFLYTGNEYAGIAQYWDWSLLPGTTAFHESDDELYTWVRNKKEELGSSVLWTDGDYSGGIADDKVSVVYVKFENEEGLEGYKSYVMYNGIAVCMGTGITCTNESNQKVINTAIDQCYAVDATYNGEKISGKEITVNDGKAVKNGAFAYYNLSDDYVLNVKSVTTTGNYKRTKPNSKRAPETDDIFTLWITHGTSPVDDSYVYAVVENANGEAPEEAEELGIKIIENNDGVQTVEFSDGTAVAVFHDTAKQCTTSDMRVLSADAENRIVISYAHRDM